MSILRSIVSRVARRTRVTIFKAPCVSAPPTGPSGLVLFRAGADSSADDRARVDAAMLAADEPADLAPERFARGDDFFGWLADAEIVCFGWVTRGPRWIGPVRMMQRPGRAFLFNFHTLDSRRGQGLYQALLNAIRVALANDQVSEAIIDANVRNAPSWEAILKSGFAPIARAEYWLLLQRWHIPIALVVLDAASELLLG